MAEQEAVLRDNARELSRAVALSAEAHGDQLAKGGAPYILHPLAVMLSRRLFSIDEMIVAVLHDTIEDTDLELSSPRVVGFGPVVCSALDAITKRKGEGWMDYLARVKEDPIALRVKLADLDHNQDTDRMSRLPLETQLRLTEKYAKARRFLS